MTLNRHECEAMQRFANQKGLPFRLDAAIFPRFNGDKGPMALRVEPEEAVRLELSDARRLSNWRKYFDIRKDQKLSDRLYSCGAGMTGFNIDPYGNLLPCLMVKGQSYNLLNGSFQDGWRTMIPDGRKIQIPKESLCADCEKRGICDFCPPFFALEKGVEAGYSEYICDIGNFRFAALKNVR
jgi:radical SAM protein with 4Fe4S-binding SPASM domain